MLQGSWVIRRKIDCDPVSAELPFFIVVSNDVRFSHLRLQKLLDLQVLQLIVNRSFARVANAQSFPKAFALALSPDWNAAQPDWSWLHNIRIARNQIGTFIHEIEIETEV